MKRKNVMKTISIRIISAFSAFAILTASPLGIVDMPLIPVSADEEFTEGTFGVFEYRIFNGEYSSSVEILKCDSSYSGKLAIPQYINDIPVHAIGSEAFKDCTKLESIDIPYNVYIIDSQAFFNCPSLKTVIIRNERCEIRNAPDTFFSFGDDNFHEIPFTGTIYCPADSNVQEFAENYSINFSNDIPEPSFLVDDPLQYLSWESSERDVRITKCDPNAFGKLVIPDEINGLPVAVIGENAFERCKNLTSVVMPEYLWEIQRDAFAECECLTSVEFNENLRMIADYSFMRCENLVNVELPDSLESLGDSAFSSCDSLKTVTFGENIQYLNNRVFDDCSQLETVILPKNLEYIGVGVFSDCKSLKNLEIPETVTTIKNFAFSDTLWLDLKREENPIVAINGILIDGVAAKGDVVIPDGVHTIKERAFYQNKDITSVKIPESVTVIEQEAFQECSNLESANIPSEISKLENRIFSDTGFREFVIPENVKVIDSLILCCCENLQKVTIMNPDCEIFMSNNTFCNYRDDDYQYYYNGIICGYENSTAQKYADKFGYTFESLGQAPNALKGDVNGDGVFSIADAVTLQKWLLGDNVTINAENSDLCNDGEIDTFDFCMIRKELVNN